MYSSTLPLTSALDGVGGQSHAPAVLPPGKIRYPLYRRLGWPQGRSGLVRKISPPPGFDPRTAQLVASRYTDWAIPARIWEVNCLKIFIFYSIDRKKYFKEFGGTYCLQLQSRTLTIERISSSETSSNIYQTTRRHIPEDSNSESYCMNMKYRKTQCNHTHN
jgi:hypothetical protein